MIRLARQITLDVCPDCLFLSELGCTRCDMCPKHCQCNVEDLLKYSRGDYS